MKYKNSNDAPIYDYVHGRWLCRDMGDAAIAVQQHKGDSVYLYDRDSMGHMTNIRPFWTPNMPDLGRRPRISNGRFVDD